MHTKKQATGRKGSTMHITAMTYNICSGRNLEGVRDLGFAAAVIRQYQPDFVTLNEVRSHTQDIGPVNQAQELGKRTGYYPVFGRSIDILGGEYGNALLTRLPLLEQEVIHIPDPEPAGEGFYEHRSILRAVLLAGDRTITVLCTHFGLMEDEQTLAVQTVLNTLKTETNPVLLMGDLNLTPEAETLAPIRSALCDTSPDGLPRTFPSDKPEIKIDYILHTPHFICESLISPDTQCSDHRPLMARLAVHSF